MTAGLERWLAADPALGKALDEDAAELAAYTADGDALLAGLRARPDRSEPEQRVAEQVLAACRRLRDRFVDRHAVRVYDELTSDRHEHHRIAELVYAAADRFPGLVPTRERIRAERQHIQAHKEGYEVDQGILLRGLLRAPGVGPHVADAMSLATPRSRNLLPTFRRSGSLDLGSVSIERRAAAAHLTIRNPHCLNAEDERLVEDLETAVDLALLDDQVRVGVLRGGVMSHPRYVGRRVFSAGVNLVDLRAGRISFVDFLMRRELGFINKLVRGLLPDSQAAGFPHRTVQKPWVAVVDSFAIGGGMQLLLVFDRVIAADDAYFSLPAAQEGIVPGAGNLRLGRLAGGRLARQVILSGHRIAATASEARLVCDEVVAPWEMDKAVETAVAEMDSSAVVANRRMLNLAEEPIDRFLDYMAEFAVAQALRLYDRDVVEKVDRRYRRSRSTEEVSDAATG